MAGTPWRRRSKPPIVRRSTTASRFMLPAQRAMKSLK